MVGLCQVAPNWYGLLYSWADSKKKSNLMLTLLEPGNNPVPWLGEISQLGISDPEKPSKSRSNFLKHTGVSRDSSANPQVY